MEKLHNRKKFRYSKRDTLIFIGAIAVLGLLSFFGNYSLAEISADSASSSTVNILFYNTNENIRFSDALDLDPSFNITTINTSAQLIDSLNSNTKRSSYDAVILMNLAITTAESPYLMSYMTEGGGIYCILGNNSANNGDFLTQVKITNSTSIKTNTFKGVAVVYNSTYEVASNIDWNSAPEIYNFWEVSPDPQAEIILKLAQEGGSQDDRQPSLIHQNVGSGQIFVSTLWLDSANNTQFTEWLYYCYFTYAMTMETANRPLTKFGDWEYAPVPQTREKTVLMTVIVIIAATAIGSFVIALKKSKNEIESDYLKKFSEQKKSKFGGDEEVKWDPTQDDWEDIGSHRQISGFLTGFFAGILVLIPQVILTGFIFPRYIMPYPQVSGMYGYAQDLFQALWTLLDMSTSVALAKYFAEYRIDKPEKAIHYVQIFIWWQFLSGIFQLTLVVSLGLFLFPHLSIAHMSYLFIFHSFIQFPGWFQVLIFLFQGLQRVDLALVCDVLRMVVFDLISKYTFILSFRAIFANIPQYGEVFGCMLGYAAGEWFGQFISFGFTTLLFKKQGFHLGTIFRVDFTMAEFKQVMVFGGKIVIGAVLVPAVYFLQTYLASIYILNYNAELGYYKMVYQITQIVALINLFTQGLMAGMSESYGNKKFKLFDYYFSQGLKWNNYMAFFFISALAVVLWRFIIGAMGPTWERCVVFIPILLTRASFEPFTWLGDQTFKATNKTGRLAISWVIEQGTRVVFLLLWIEQYQMMGILYSWFISLVLKIVYQYFGVWKYVRLPKVYWWQCFIAPAISAVINYVIFEAVAKAIFQYDMITSIILFLLVFVVFINIYSFMMGFFGGWDDNTLKEFERAMKMVKGVSYFAKALYKSTEFGARHSLFHLHGKHPIEIYEEAAHEARELTVLKKQVVI